MDVSGVGHNSPHTMTYKCLPLHEDFQAETEHEDVSVDMTDDERRHPRARRVRTKIGRLVRIDCSVDGHSRY